MNAIANEGGVAFCATGCARFMFRLDRRNPEFDQLMFFQLGLKLDQRFTGIGPTGKDGFLQLLQFAIQSTFQTFDFLCPEGGIGFAGLTFD